MAREMDHARKALHSVDEYLAIEQSSEERHEYLDGEIYALESESGEHSDICVSLASSLYGQLKGTACRVRLIGTVVRCAPSATSPGICVGLYAYPDVVVIRGEPQTDPTHDYILVNPAVIVEVLSPATEAFDRSEKLTRYLTWVPTLHDLMLVSQDRPCIEQYSRRAGGNWSFRIHTGLNSNIGLPSIDCVLNLADPYDRVVFTE